MRHLVIGTAGHIDHGKSALVRALTGIDPDRLKEEQLRGITIDLGFAHLEAGGVTLAFVDVPGHERFVRNMLAGVGGIDAVMLVVASDESVMPQTREHFEICRLLHVPAGLVALTKRDLVDEETIELVRLEVRDLVAGSFLDGGPALPVSAKTGEGLGALRAALVGLADRVGPRGSRGPARLPIDRAFTVKGFGTVVTGTLVSGTIALEQELSVLPAGRTVKVRGVQVHGRAEARAEAGQRVAVNLGGVEVGDLGRGDTLVEEGSVEPTRVVDALVETVPGTRPLRHGARVRFHQGTSEVLGRLALAGLTTPGAAAPAGGAGGQGGRGPQPAAGAAGFVEIPPGHAAYARLRLESPAVLTRGDRYILRAYSPPATIAGGVVLDPHPPRAGIRRPGSRARFERLDPGEALSDTSRQSAADRAVMVMVDESGGAGLPIAAITSRAGIAPAARQDVVDRLARSGAVARAGDRLVARAVLDGLERTLLAALRDYHRLAPLSEGMPREEARERIFGRSTGAVFERVLDDLTARGSILARERLALAGHRVSLSADEEQARRRIEERFRAADLKPPDAATLAADTGAGPDVIDRVLKLLVRQKVLVRVDTLLFHRDALARLREQMAALKRDAAGAPATIDVAAFKETYGVTRKFAIPLLEYLDRERVTRRVGDVRIVV